MEVPREGGVDDLLTACDREPIRVPGSIQPHGVLLVLGPGDLVVRAASANAPALFGRPKVIGHRLGDLAPAFAHPPFADLAHRVVAADPRPLGTVAVGVGDAACHAVAHRADGHVLLELEPADPGGGTGPEATFAPVSEFLDGLARADGIAGLAALAARVIRTVTGFDRVLVYRFEPDWSGIVIAEDRNDVLPTCLGLRFPATDIPRQARDLYRLNRLRLIPDAAYAPVPLEGGGGVPLDLGFAALRSVSPVHLEYMRNMGTGASFSVSLIGEGRLRGLVACHARDPRRVPPGVRAACDMVGQILSLQIAARERAEDAERRVALRAVRSRLLLAMASHERFALGLADRAADLLALAGASGAAIVAGSDRLRLGDAPPADAIERIVRWLEERGVVDVFATDTLASVMPGGEAVKDTAAGLLAIAVSRLHPSYVLWFRPEVVRTVRWGGDPTKPVDEAGRLHPRRSFETWKETVRLKADAWTEAEIDAARDLRTEIVDIVLRKAEEMAQLAEQLERSNKELEAFSYSVSHDLRAPFRHIVGYSELLRQYDGERLSERGRRYVDTIVDSALSAGRLVDSLLSFAQMGRASLTRLAVDVRALAEEERERLSRETGDRRIDWRIGDLPRAWADPAMLRLVVQNLLSNAVKFTRGRDPATIEVGGRMDGGEAVFHVRDDGVGFDPAYVHKLFGVFQRLHRVEEFEGTGIGLANVRRIVERHGGRVWADGAPDAGATFFFTLPPPPPPSSGTDAND